MAFIIDEETKESLKEHIALHILWLSLKCRVITLTLRAAIFKVFLFKKRISYYKGLYQRNYRQVQTFFSHHPIRTLPFTILFE